MCGHLDFLTFDFFINGSYSTPWREIKTLGLQHVATVSEDFQLKLDNDLLLAY